MNHSSFPRWIVMITVLFCGLSVRSSAKASPSASASAPGVSASPRSVSVCSFNIQFLGSSERRDNAALADLVSPYDIVVVQELVAAPAEKPTDKPKSRQNSAAFFREMTSRGFAYVMSASDTGRTGPLTNYSTATEWWVTFYRQAAVRPVDDVPHGFISTPLAKNRDFDRVPYAFAFRTTDSNCDFVLISVHLNPDDPTRRKGEFSAIWRWIAAERARQAEQDFVVLGDTNLQNEAELRADTPSNFISLNEACVPTNVSPTSPRPYDHVIFDPSVTTEIDRGFGFQVVSLIREMRSKWHGTAPYPGDPFEQNVFRFYYSDHNPVSFRMRIPDRDDD